MHQLNMRFLSDQPIAKDEQDILGFAEFVELIRSSIHQTEPPFVYGLLGDWGVGKTSVLRLLEQQLQLELNDPKQPNFIPIWFNAWEYENEANIIYPLLYAIKSNYTDRLGSIDKEREFWKKFTEVSVTSALVLADVGLRVATKHLTGEALKLADIAKQLKEIKEHPSELEGVFSEWADNVSRLKEAFEELLSIYAADLSITNNIESDSVRFVILIDDLDRCLPDTTISVLESIKNFLSSRKAIFILGLNPKVVYQGIRVKYRGLDIDGREYLEKILNYTFYIPEPKLDHVANFATSKLQELVPDKTQREDFREYFDDFGLVLQECKFNNPRKIKRILNRYLLFLKKYSDRLERYHMPNIIRLLIIAEYFPDLFQLILDDTSEFRNYTNFGTKEFEVENFERKFGISITPIYPQLSRMNNLFVLKETKGTGKPKIKQQAQDVFSITRLT
jgi:hypothetical protein